RACCSPAAGSLPPTRRRAPSKRLRSCWTRRAAGVVFGSWRSLWSWRGWAAVQAPRIIAEIGCNHRGELATAREMVRVAAILAGVDAVKFQKRNPRECLTPEQYNAPHPVPAHAYGPTYGLHRERLELPLAAHRELKELCETLGVAYSASVWDMTGAREIMSLAPAMIKVSSACNPHADVLKDSCDEFGGEIDVSLCITIRPEEEAIVGLLAARRRLADAVLYAGVSGYPVTFEDLSLLEIELPRVT